MKRWKFFYPLVRCPWCRKWCAVDHRGNVTLRRPRKTELAEVRADDSPTSPKRVSSAHAREGADE